MIEIDEDRVSSLVVENQQAFRLLLTDLCMQAEGFNGSTVLSEANKPISIAKNIEIIKDFAPFEFNGKALQTKLTNAIDAISRNEQHWLRTQELLNSCEMYIGELAEDFQCDIECSKLSFTGILKSLGISAAGKSEDQIGEVLNYMELVRQIDRDRLFVTVNMRSWFDDESMKCFFKDVLGKKLRLLLLESTSRRRLENERRWTVDHDLCEF
ncbi:MAG: type II-A CRISPR-associated protein Csn2 [Clostridia bacterium]|nr:type II-A CRISPR-associated protein Csn2 [Clostridia bacterium]